MTKGGGRGSAFESEDRSTLFYVKHAGDFQVWKMPVAGGPESPVPETLIGGGQNYALVSDGLYLIARPRGLRFFDFATGKVTQLIPTPNSHLGLSVSPEGRSILYSQYEREATSLMLVENFR